MQMTNDFKAANFCELSEKELSDVTGNGKGTNLTQAALAGAVAGAYVGSVIPVVGTGFGAMLGAKWGIAIYGIARYGI